MPSLNAVLPSLRCLPALLATGIAWSGDLKLNAYVDLHHISYFDNPDAAKVNARNQALTQVELSSSSGSQASVFTSLEFRADQSDPGRNRFLLKEAFASLFFDKVDLKVGNQIFVWGKADGFNPTDVLAPRDFTDPLITDDNRLGILAARLGVRALGLDMEGIVSPVFQPSLLPPPGSRWWLDPELPPVPGLVLRWANPPLPDEALRQSQAAVRISGSVGGWEYTLMKA